MRKICEENNRESKNRTDNMTEIKEQFHGSDLEKIERFFGIPKEQITGFGANVNPLGVSPKMRKKLTESIDVITSYPDPDYRKLREHIAAYTGYELRLTRAVLTGILELGCGIGAMEGAALTPVNLAACSFLIGFGGISVAMQTASVLSGTEIKISRHLAGRFLNACISAFTVYTIASILL